MRNGLLFVALFPIAASAADVTASQASKILEGCSAHAKSRSQSHAIFVVDTGGHVVASLRMDGNSYGIAEFAREKAEAVAAWRSSTEEMQGAAEQTPGFGDGTLMSKRFGGFLPVVVDCETGGFNHQTDALLEIAAVIVKIDEQGKLYRGATHTFHLQPFEGANLEPAPGSWTTSTCTSCRAGAATPTSCLSRRTPPLAMRSFMTLFPHCRGSPVMPLPITPSRALRADS